MKSRFSEIDYDPKDSPIVKTVYNTFMSCCAQDLDREYFSEFSGIKRWKCFSDYSLDDQKPNNVVTFTFSPYTQYLQELMDLINFLCPKEIKKTRKVNEHFISFIRSSPFLTFSFIIKNPKYLFENNHEGLRRRLITSIEILESSILERQTPSPDQISRNKIFLQHLSHLKNLAVGNKKIQLIKNMILITSIGSVLATLICNRTNAEVFGWFSDRDAINDLSKNFSIELFQCQFIQHVKNQNCQFVAAPASSKDNEWYSPFIKIPDFITGALADFKLFDDHVSHDKFIPVIRDLIADNNRNVFVHHLKFHDNGFAVSCPRVHLNKKE